jgi:choline/glycine/proline betaine transport protein
VGRTIREFVAGVLFAPVGASAVSDSGSLVVDILTNGGDPHPVWQQRLFWAVTEGTVAAVLLYAGSAMGEDPLSVLQTAALASGLPFCVVLLVMCYSLVKALRQDTIFADAREATPTGRQRSAVVAAE